MTDDKLRAALDAWERNGAPNRKSLAAFGLRAALAASATDDHDEVSERLDHPGNRADGVRPAVPEALDVERLAIAMSYVEMRTMASPTEPGPQTLRDAEAIAREYAALRPKEPTDD